MCNSDLKNVIQVENESPWYLYMIQCGNGHLYTGITKDIERRFNEHQAGGPKSAKYLKGKGPLTLVYSECVGSHSQALKLEINIKKLSRPQKLLLVASIKS
jgi:putative endonuclease